MEKGVNLVVGLVIVSHGALAKGLLDAAQMILGGQEQIEAIGLAPHEGLSDLSETIAEAIARVNRGDGYLLIADLNGGTPCNASGLLIHVPGFHLVSGANLPMLLEVLMARSTLSANELAVVALEAGKNGVQNVGEEIRRRLKAEQ